MSLSHALEQGMSEAMFAAIDTDNSGTISMDEFIAYQRRTSFES
jgi:Ca2+-binding EF-hand superfamily protein